MCTLQFTTSFIILLCLLVPVTPLTFLNSKSYAVYDQWDASTDGTLKFSFKTYKPDGTLVYIDDGGKFDFLQLAISSGRLRLTTNIGGIFATADAGKFLQDLEWHQVEIIRNYGRTQLILDNSETVTATSYGRTDSKFMSESFLYIGGLPEDISLSDVSLPSVAYDPPFLGCIEDVKFTKAGNNMEGGLVKSGGTEDSCIDACLKSNPCLNRGRCINKFTDTECDCQGTGFGGEICDQDSPVITLPETSYLMYDLTLHSDASLSDHISFRFKSTKSDGILFQTMFAGDYLTIELLAGDISLAIDLGSGPMRFSAGNGNLGDDMFHTVDIKRLGHDVIITVDDLYRMKGKTAGKFTRFEMTGDNKAIYIGGAPDPTQVTTSKSMTNFVGCLQQFFFNGVNLIEAFVGSDSSVNIQGHYKPGCVAMETDSSQEINFKSTESFLSHELKSGSITSLELQFRSTDANGIIVYKNGIDMKSQHFFALEIFNGFIYLVENVGFGVWWHKGFSSRVDDGRWHAVKIMWTGYKGDIIVDGIMTGFDSEKGNANGGVTKDVPKLDEKNMLYMGGLSKEAIADFPKEIALDVGYVGCVRELSLNSERVDLVSLLTTDSKNDVQKGCQILSSQCRPGQCKNNGVCLKAEKNGAECDCAETIYNGEKCNKESSVMSFSGTNYVHYNRENPLSTEADEIIFHFKTQHPNGLLLMTRYQDGSDSILVYLEQSKLVVSANLGSGIGELRMPSSAPLSNNQWHIVIITRKKRSISVQLDGKLKSVVTPGDMQVLDTSSVLIGGLKSESGVSKNGRVVIPNFQGCLRQVRFNLLQIIELATKSKDSGKLLDVNAEMGCQQSVQNEVTFSSIDAVLTAPKPEGKIENVKFSFKTSESNGLVLFMQGEKAGFLTVLLQDGKVKMFMDRNMNHVEMESSKSLSDNQWHHVQITFMEARGVMMTVDDVMLTKATTQKLEFMSSGSVYVGGMQHSALEHLPLGFNLNPGYLGCLGNLEINNVPMNLQDLASSTEHVQTGCNDPMGLCTPGICQNGGFCSEEGTDLKCDCSYTTYDGQKCDQEPPMYEFGENGGAVTYKHRYKPTTEQDSIILAFSTNKLSGTLVYISTSSTKKFMMLELVRGLLTYRLNLGDGLTSGTVLSEPLSDGKRHTVNLFRNGGHATVQVDEGTPLRLSSRVKYTQLKRQGTIRLGSAPEDKNPFVGKISGFEMNKLKVLEQKACEDSSRVELSGDVKLGNAEPDMICQKNLPFTLPPTTIPTTITTTEMSTTHPSTTEDLETTTISISTTEVPTTTEMSSSSDDVSMTTSTTMMPSTMDMSTEISTAFMETTTEMPTADKQSTTDVPSSTEMDASTVTTATISTIESTTEAGDVTTATMSTIESTTEPGDVTTATMSTIESTTEPGAVIDGATQTTEMTTEESTAPISESTTAASETTTEMPSSTTVAMSTEEPSEIEYTVGPCLAGDMSCDTTTAVTDMTTQMTTEETAGILVPQSTTEMTTQEVTTEETTAEMTTGEMTTQETTTEENIAEVTTQETTEERTETTDEMTTEEMTTQETTVEMTTQKTTDEMTTEEMTTQEMTTEEMVTQETTTEETTAVMTTEETTAEVSGNSCGDDNCATDLSTTQLSTTESEESTTSAPESTTEEITTESTEKPTVSTMITKELITNRLVPDVTTTTMTPTNKDDGVVGKRDSGDDDQEEESSFDVILIAVIVGVVLAIVLLALLVLHLYKKNTGNYRMGEPKRHLDDLKNQKEEEVFV